jgi:hypothetical protein
LPIKRQVHGTIAGLGGSQNFSAIAAAPVNGVRTVLSLSGVQLFVGTALAPGAQAEEQQHAETGQAHSRLG